MKVKLFKGENLAIGQAYEGPLIQLVLWSTPYPGLRGFKVTVADYLEKWLPDRVAAWAAKMDQVTGVYAQVIKFPRTKSGWYDRRQLQIANLICDYAGMQMIDVIPWDKKNAPPSGNVARYDHDAYEFIFLAAKSEAYTYHKFRKEYKEKTKKKAAAANRDGTQLGFFGDQALASPYRKSGLASQPATGNADLNEAGAIQDNVYRISATGEERRPRVKGGSFPLALADRIIRQYSDPGDWIADPCAGAGTSAIAGMRSGRNVVAVEVLPNRFDIMANWVEVENVKAGGHYTIGRYTHDESL